LVPDASVLLFSLEEVREVRTDHLGQFAFMDLPLGMYELEVKSAGFKTAFLGSISVSGAPVPQISTTLQLTPTGCGDFQPTASYPERSGKVNLTGTVKDYSAGFVKNATLTLTLSGSSRGQSTNTNENGEFQFTDLAPGKYTMKVAQEDYFEASVTKFWVTRKNLTALTPICVFRRDQHTVILCQ
jgi:carboxypeptidase family protein